MAGCMSQTAVSDRKDTKLLKAIHNSDTHALPNTSAVSDRKDTKLLKAIHNKHNDVNAITRLFQTAKIQNF